MFQWPFHSCSDAETFATLGRQEIPGQTERQRQRPPGTATAQERSTTEVEKCLPTFRQLDRLHAPASILALGLLALCFDFGRFDQSISNQKCRRGAPLDLTLLLFHLVPGEMKIARRMLRLELVWSTFMLNRVKEFLHVCYERALVRTSQKGFIVCIVVMTVRVVKKSLIDDLVDSADLVSGKRAAHDINHHS